MSYGNKPQYPTRVKTILDDGKLKLSADPIAGGTGRQTLSLYVANTPNQCKWRQLKLHRTRAKAFAGHDVDVEILHRAIEILLDRTVQAVNFIDKQNRPWF